MRRLNKDGCELHVIRPTALNHHYKWGAKLGTQHIRGRAKTEHDAWVMAEDAARTITLPQERLTDEEEYY